MQLHNAVMTTLTIVALLTGEELLPKAQMELGIPSYVFDSLGVLREPLSDNVKQHFDLIVYLSVETTSRCVSRRAVK